MTSSFALWYEYNFINVLLIFNFIKIIHSKNPSEIKLTPEKEHDDVLWWLIVSFILKSKE